MHHQNYRWKHAQVRSQLGLLKLGFLEFTRIGCCVTIMPASTMAEVLTPIWESVLQRSSIRPEDNFFDLGGDSLLAVELFTKIAQVCGRELAPVTIYCAPTIASLAAILEEPAPPRFPPLLQLREGTETPPLFLAHGSGWNSDGFFSTR